MPDYIISQIHANDINGNMKMDVLLQQEGLQRDSNLDYSCGMFDDEMHLIATGSCFGNTLRCLAVTSLHQGEGLMNQIITHLMEVQISRGNTHLFLYTKCSSAKFFHDLGFYEIARIEGQLVFMENRKDGFSRYLNKIGADHKWGTKIAAIVMNANPFTLGHLYLVEKALAKSDVLHLFIVSEDSSLVPFKIRKRLIIEGTAHLNGILYHDSGPYIISNATFPSYFQKDISAVIESHARLDLAIFIKIAKSIGITQRYVGEEPYSHVTGIYNQIMSAELPRAGIDCTVVPRLQQNGITVSASTVRQAIKENNIKLLHTLVPDSTFQYFLSEEATPVTNKIRAANNVIHY